MAQRIRRSSSSRLSIASRTGRTASSAATRIWHSSAELSRACSASRIATAALARSASVAEYGRLLKAQSVRRWRLSCASRSSRWGSAKDSRVRATMASIRGSSAGCRLVISASKPSSISLRWRAESHRYSYADRASFAFSIH